MVSFSSSAQALWLLSSNLRVQNGKKNIRPFAIVFPTAMLLPPSKKVTGLICIWRFEGITGNFIRRCKSWRCWMCFSLCSPWVQGEQRQKMVESLTWVRPAEGALHSSFDHDEALSSLFLSLRRLLWYCYGFCSWGKRNFTYSQPCNPTHNPARVDVTSCHFACPVGFDSTTSAFFCNGSVTVPY